ncbi:hypothetical protein D9M68_20230 [compost metagenome]
MKDLAVYVDVVITVLAFIGIVFNLAVSYLIFKQDFNVYVMIELIIKSVRISMFSWNKLSLINWVGCAVIYLPLAYYGQFVYLTFTAAVVVVFCIFYLIMDLVRPVENIG